MNCRFGAALLVFFITSSMFTKFGEDKKQKVDADFKEGGQRNWSSLSPPSSLFDFLFQGI